MNRNGRLTERWTKPVKPAGIGRGMTRVRSTEAKNPSTMTAPMMPSSTRTANPFRPRHFVNISGCSWTKSRTPVAGLPVIVSMSSVRRS